MSLDSLPSLVLDQIVHHLTPPQGTLFGEESDIDNMRYEKESAPPHPDVVALGSVNTSLRSSLSPVLFKCIEFGYLRPPYNRDPWRSLDMLAEKGSAVLPYVRHLTIYTLAASDFEPANECIKQMMDLSIVEYSATLSFPPLFVDTLLEKLHFHKLYFNVGGCESLPAILPLAKQITHFEIDARIRFPRPAESLKYCPITVAAARRAGLENESNCPTSAEQSAAFVDGLSKFLPLAKDLEYLKFDPEDLIEDRGAWIGYHKWLQQLFDSLVNENREYPRLFPKMKRLVLRHTGLSSIAVKHLLRTSGPNLTHLELSSVLEANEIEPPQVALSKLQMLCLCIADNVSGVPFMKKVAQDAPLRELVLNGLKPVNVPAVFGFRYDSLAGLRVVCYESGVPFSVRHLGKIVEACPNLERLMFKAVYSGEALDYLRALHPLSRLRCLAFDHPFSAPRSFPFPSPDGQTIRSERNGDFRVLTVLPGQTVYGVMKSRIKADIEAVKPIYIKHFTTLARRIPSLEKLIWYATEKVEWTWTFWRDEVDDGKGGTKSRVRFRQKAEIDYPMGGQVFQQGMVLQTLW